MSDRTAAALLGVPRRSRQGPDPWALGVVGALLGAAVVVIALCPDEVCLGVGKEWPWPIDLFMAVSFLGVAALISIQATGNRLAGVLALAGSLKLLEMDLGVYGHTVSWQAARMVFLAVVWHAALSFPLGDPKRSGWILSTGWATWAVVGWGARALWADPDSLGAGAAIVPLPDAPEAVGSLLASVATIGNVLIIASLGLLLTRFFRGDRQARRSMAPLLMIVPIVMLTVVDEALVRAGLVDATFLSASAWSEIAVLAVPWGIAAGLIRSRLWGGEVARLVVAAERAGSPEELERVAADTLGDPTAAVGLVRDPSGELVSVDGRPFPDPNEPGRLREPLVVEDKEIGFIDHVDSVPRVLAEQTAMTIALSMDRLRLQTEVRAQMAEVLESRKRVIEAADNARRQIERDLHDGAQQRLLALSMEADRLRIKLERSEVSDAIVDDAVAISRAAKDAHAELRDLARGMYPPTLEADGLASAIESLAGQFEGGGSTIRTDVEVERLGSGVEGAAYFVIAEAVTNAVRHAGSGSIAVEVRQGQRELSIVVTDDGRGGADMSRGSGLVGLSDRLGAVGGRMELSSPPGGPTRLSAWIPLLVRI